MWKIVNFAKRNKITLIVAILLFSIYYIIYSNFESNKINELIIETKAKSPYILVTEGNAIIKRLNEIKIIKMESRVKKLIKLHDKIRTMNDSSATIFWPDGSITRLGSKTSITINELTNTDDLSTYKINFDLETGKTWSNIIKFLTDDSYFTETYDNGNYAATARGTIFEINLDNNYINAFSHDIVLSNISENTIFDIKQGEVINALDPMSKTAEFNIDKEWVNSNISKDKEYFNNIYKEWQDKATKLDNAQTIGTKTVSYFKYKTGINKDGYIISNINKSMITGDTTIIEETKKIIPQLQTNKKYLLNNELIGVYNNIHSLQGTSNLSNFKSNLRNLIIKTGKKGKKLDDLKNKFLKLDIYDYVDLVKKKGEQGAIVLKNNIISSLDEIRDPAKITELLGNFSEDILGVLKISFDDMKQGVNSIFENTKKIQLNDDMKQKVINESEQIKQDVGEIIGNLKNKIGN